jgi:hypothetical protein
MSGEDPTAKVAPGDEAARGTLGTGVVIEEVRGA